MAAVAVLAAGPGILQVADTDPPQTSIDSGPTGTVESATATFTFSSSEPGSTFQCDLDGDGFIECVSPATYTRLPDGTHTFRVRAIDEAGNVDQSPATRTWRVDTRAPETAITSGPSGTVASATATFTFSSSEPGSTFQCNLDGDGFFKCSSPATYSGLSNGTHTFRVRAVDPQGHVDSSPSSRTWTVDTVPPQTTIVSGPFGTVSSSTAVLSFSSSESGSSFECRLDGGSFVRCQSPVVYSGLRVGSHRFEVRAVDRAGNRDPVPATRTWTIATAATQSPPEAGSGEGGNAGGGAAPAKPKPKPKPEREADDTGDDLGAPPRDLEAREGNPGASGPTGGEAGFSADAILSEDEGLERSVSASRSEKPGIIWSVVLAVVPLGGVIGAYAFARMVRRLRA